MAARLVSLPPSVSFFRRLSLVSLPPSVTAPAILSTSRWWLLLPWVTALAFVTDEYFLSSQPLVSLPPSATVQPLVPWPTALRPAQPLCFSRISHRPSHFSANQFNHRRSIYLVNHGFEV